MKIKYSASYIISTGHGSNQLLQLCTARTAWSDSVIRSKTSLITESDRFGPIR